MEPMKVTAAQATPALLDRDATLAKVVALCKKAAPEGRPADERIILGACRSGRASAARPRRCVATRSPSIGCSCRGTSPTAPHS